MWEFDYFLSRVINWISGAILLIHNKCVSCHILSFDDTHLCNTYKITQVTFLLTYIYEAFS